MYVNVIIALKIKYITSSKKIRFKFTFNTEFDILKPSNTKLKKGMNVVELSFAGKNWTRLGNMEFLAFNIGGAVGEPERALYIADSVIYAE